MSRSSPRGGTPLAELERVEPHRVRPRRGAQGLPEEVVAACDAVASIPIAGSAESLNVAVAGAIALYEASRR